MRDDSQRARIARQIDESYWIAKDAVAAEASLERRYHVEPGAAIARAHAAEALRFEHALATIVADGGAGDAATIRQALADQRAYRAATTRLFAAIVAHDGKAVLALDRNRVDPVLSRIEAEVNAGERKKRLAADTALHDLEDTQLRILRANVIFGSAGVALLGLFVAALLSHRRRLSDRHRGEVATLEAALVVDGLTLLGNHRAFKDDVARACARTQRPGQTLSLAMIDVDEFKVINDENGHLHGDRVLQDLARLLREGRPQDRAYRVGGDEFALILPNTSAAEAAVVLERVRAAAAKLLARGTISIGHATANGVACTPEMLQAWADAALYETKRGGRNGVSGFNAALHATWLVSGERVQNLRALINDEAISVAFQPIWDVSGTVLGYEALARPHPRYGFMSPQDAFDLAERIGCAPELDSLCRRAGLKHVAALPVGALLFINVSPQTLDRSLDVDGLRRSTIAAGIAPERVVLEITERSAAHMDAVVETARRLQTAGFHLALDDTGAGHAGLEILSRVPFEYVKIDREIIVNALRDRNAAGVVAAILAFAQTSDAYVIAEGIEDEAMLAFVRSCGRFDREAIRGVQGNLFGPPGAGFLDDAGSAAGRMMLLESVA